MTNPHSIAKGKRRPDLDNVYYRSKMEANVARYLRWLQSQGQIVSWEYEPETFHFEGVKRNPISYTPDFRVTYPDGRIEYHEIKGWLDSVSRSKLKRMARFYPAVKIVLIQQPEYRAIAQWAGMIEGWE